MTTPATPRDLAPRNWRREDLQRRGLPRYAADDLDGIRAELRDGAGFVLVQGLLADSDAAADAADAAIQLRRFGERLGRLLPQNARQETLVEIADFSDEDAFDDRGYRSPGELQPHTDPPPLIALLCLRPARQGGANRLVSAASIREAIRDRQADALPLLEAGLPFFMPDEETPGGGEVKPALPILLDGPDGLSCVYYRPFIERAVAAGARLPDGATAALDLFDRCATDPALQVEHSLTAGEALILNNYRVLHARDDYEDWPEKAKRRRLLRLWLDADWLPEPPAAHAGRRNPMAAML